MTAWVIGFHLELLRCENDLELQRHYVSGLDDIEFTGKQGKVPAERDRSAGETDHARPLQQPTGASTGRSGKSGVPDHAGSPAQWIVIYPGEHRESDHSQSTGSEVKGLNSKKSTNPIKTHQTPSNPIKNHQNLIATNCIVFSSNYVPLPIQSVIIWVSCQNSIEFYCFSFDLFSVFDFFSFFDFFAPVVCRCSSRLYPTSFFLPFRFFPGFFLPFDSCHWYLSFFRFLWFTFTVNFNPEFMVVLWVVQSCVRIRSGLVWLWIWLNLVSDLFFFFCDWVGYGADGFDVDPQI